MTTRAGTSRSTSLLIREWISPQRFGNLPPVMSAHPGYSQQFGSRQVLHISDHLIAGQV